VCSYHFYFSSKLELCVKKDCQFAGFIVYQGKIASIKETSRQSIKKTVNRQKFASIRENPRQSKKILINQGKFPSIEENLRQSKKIVIFSWKFKKYRGKRR